MKKILLTAVAAVALLAACEKRIDIDVDDQRSELVVNSVNTDQADIAVRLTLSRPIYGSFYVAEDESYFKKVENANVTLAIGGSGEMSAVRDGNVYTLLHHPQPGEELTLRVEVPGYEAATATATVPYAPVVENVTVDLRDTMGLSNSIYGASLKFTLVDNGESSDFYGIYVRVHDMVYRTYYDTLGAVMAKDTIDQSYYTYYDCTDYLIIDARSVEDILDVEDPAAASTYSGNQLLFSDANINGQRHSIELMLHKYTDYYYEDYEASAKADIDWEALDHIECDTNSTATLEVVSMTRDVFMYKQTRTAYSDDGLLGFFSEPVQIHSNIDGGIGIFGFLTRTQYSFSYNE